MKGADIDVLRKYAAARKVMKELKDAVDNVIDVVGAARSGKNG
jgi:hypothetical protein